VLEITADRAVSATAVEVRARVICWPGVFCFKLVTEGSLRKSVSKILKVRLLTDP
jgi:hypothetical protein